MIPLEDFLEYFEQGAAITTPDLKDVTYFSLALKLNGIIWSNDKKLKERRIVHPTFSHIHIIRVRRLFNKSAAANVPVSIDVNVNGSISICEV